MKHLRTLTFKASALAALVLPASAFAGPGSITHTPASQAIPTLSTSMLIVLSILLMIVAFRLKKQNGTNAFFVTLLGTSFIVASGSGIKLVSDLEAGIGGVITFETTGGETITELMSGGFYRITNTTSITQEITAINPPAGCGNFPDGVGLPGPECKVGTRLQTYNEPIMFGLLRKETTAAAPVRVIGPEINEAQICFIDCSSVDD